MRRGPDVGGRNGLATRGSRMKWSAVAISTEFDFISARVQPLQTRYKTFRFHSPGLGQRRKVLDEALITCVTATPGVQVHTGVRVDGLIRERDTVTGLRVAGQEYRAPLGVAADGAQGPA